MWTAIAAAVILFQEIMGVAEHFLSPALTIGATSVVTGFLSLLIFAISFLILDTIRYGIFHDAGLSRTDVQHQEEQRRESTRM
jgi:hypothetical protein